MSKLDFTELEIFEYLVKELKEQEELDKYLKSDEYKKRVEEVEKANKLQEKARYIAYYENLEKSFNKIGLSIIDEKGNYLKDNEILALLAEKWDNWKE